jgi:radical SAM protein with 4Fe4S-binding SPASM domain
MSGGEIVQQSLRRAYRLAVLPGRKQRIQKWLEFRRVQAERGRMTVNREVLDKEIGREAIELRSHPVTLYIDPATACNLRCPFCPTGGGYTQIKAEVLKPNEFEVMVSNIEISLLERVCLYNWGEPLLNKYLPEYIRYFTDRRKPTTISTNLSVKDYDDEYLETLVGSGLTEILVSIDGGSQESYEKYRIRGDFHRVVRNMAAIDRVKQRLGSQTPFVRYKMLLNKHNQHEVEEARRIAEECGAIFSLEKNFWCPDDLRDEWIADSIRAEYGDLTPSSVSMRRTGTIHTECRQLWDSIFVSANGDVFPCCLVYKPSQRVGNLLEQHIMEIRNSPEMVQMRRFVCDINAPPLDFDNYCNGCTSRYCTHDLAAT